MATEKKLIKTPEGQPDLVELKAEVKGGKMKGHKVTVLLNADDVVKEQVGDFVDFLRDHAVLGVAIGFVAGSQAQAVIKQLTDSFITPLINLIIGGASLSERAFHVRIFHNSQQFAWGKMILVLINLFAVLATVYLLIKLLQLDKLEKKQ